MCVLKILDWIQNIDVFLMYAVLIMMAAEKGNHK